MKIGLNANLELPHDTYVFYNELADQLDCPIDDILSTMLAIYAQIMAYEPISKVH